MISREKLKTVPMALTLVLLCFPLFCEAADADPGYVEKNQDYLSKVQILEMARQGRTAFFSESDPYNRNSYAIARMLRKEYGVLVPFQVLRKREAGVDEDKHPEIGVSNWIHCANWMNSSAYLLNEISKAKISPNSGSRNESVKSQLGQLSQYCAYSSGAPLPMVVAFNSFLDEYAAALNQFVVEKNDRRKAELTAELERTKAEAIKQQEAAAQREEVRQMETQLSREKAEAKIKADEATRLVREKTEKEQQEQQRKTIAARGAALRSGKILVENMGDASLLLNAATTAVPIFKPSLKPDNKIYAWGGSLERLDGGLYIVKLGENYFGFKKKPTGTKTFNEAELRINGFVSVIGQYTDNVEYVTVIGDKRYMPVLKAEYIEGR